ncbi:NmrA family NAD(P)-binding protein [Chitinophaga sp. YIM B06452]|uniref:NmrA family NAD(P)-binding protein n=1 Tax=Chitinophaga sp. YIM B06452 TaxID=3082158 RepID=UPI0031FEA399
MSDTVLVLGATGLAGKELVKLLAGKNVQVKAATRTPEKFQSPAPNVAPVRLVQEEASTFAPALAGVNKVFLSALPLDAAAAAKLFPFVDEAKKAGVKKIVFLSALGVENHDSAPLRQVELYVQKSGIPNGILRANFFMENFTEGPFSGTVKASNQIILAADNAAYNMVSTADIAAVAAELLLNDTLPDQELTLTGPGAIDHYQVADIITTHSGRNITYLPISEADLLSGMKAQGAPDSVAQYLAVLMASVRSGANAVVTTAVKDITGKEPVSFEEFSKLNAGKF